MFIYIYIYVYVHSERRRVPPQRPWGARAAGPLVLYYSIWYVIVSYIMVWYCVWYNYSMLCYVGMLWYNGMLCYVCWLGYNYTIIIP